MNLSTQQRDALDSALMHSSGLLFVTGKAGTGKSTVLRELRNSRKAIVLAPTGLAAVNVGGQTIHSFFGIKPGPVNDAMVGGLRDRAKKALKECKCVVIDEISMVRADLMDAIDKCLRRTYDEDAPFGGIAIVAFGDPYQIEPVVSTDAEAQMLGDTYRSPFFFDAKCLAGKNIRAIELTQSFRQEEGTRFVSALNSIREGELNEATDSFLWTDGMGHLSPLQVVNTRVKSINSVSEHTIVLTMTNRFADQINRERLGRIDSDKFCYDADESGEWSGETPAPSELRLKVGARVMTVANKRDYEELVHSNGDLGTVTACGEDYISVDLDNGKSVEVERYTWERLRYEYSQLKGLSAEVVGTFKQFPLKLAWAATVHKSQGQTYDDVHLLLETRGFAHGQVYVALSRCRTLEGMSLERRLTSQDVVVRPRVTEWLEEQRGVAV